MLFTDKLCFVEETIQQYEKELLDVLLIDRTTRKNIIWATDNYKELGESFGSDCEITSTLLAGESAQLIRPRVEKSYDEQETRTHDKAEVFTPCWVCNVQNNLVDREWFDGRDVFNVSDDSQEWTVIREKVPFPISGVNSWEKYVDAKRLEVSCGEAPYLVSRYDTVTGKIIPIPSRIGLLDRKLRVVTENTETEDEWIKWAIRAFQAVYGYEYQGDNLLLARVNLLITFIEYYQHRFHKVPDKELLLDIARIVSWNLWQMDGLKCVVPNSCKPIVTEQFTFFGVEVTKEPCAGCKTGDYHSHTGIYCKIMDWRENASLTFVSMLKGARI